MLKGHLRRLRVARASELGAFVGDTLYTAAWQNTTAIADIAQIALLTHFLGVSAYGRFAVVVAFALLVDQFFDVRVTLATTTLGARALRVSNSRAVGVFQASYSIDAATGVLGCAVIAALAPLVGSRLAGSSGETLLLLYATVLLGATLDNTSGSVLRLLGQFRILAALNLVLETVRVLLVGASLVLFRNLVAVVIALAIHAVMAGTVRLAATGRSVRRKMERSLFQREPLPRTEWRNMLGMVFHTNLISYARLAQTQLPTVLVGVFSGSAVAGLFKVGMTLGATIGRLADPAYIALTPRVSHLLAAGRLREIRRLIRQSSWVAVPCLGAAFVLVVAFRVPLAQLLTGSRLEVTSVVLLAATGAALNGMLFWNVPVVIAAGLQFRISRLVVGLTVLQVLLLLVLIPTLEATGAALSFLIIQIIMNAANTWLAIQVLRGYSDVRLLRGRRWRSETDGRVKA